MTVPAMGKYAMTARLIPFSILQPVVPVPSVGCLMVVGSDMPHCYVLAGRAVIQMSSIDLFHWVAFLQK